MKVEEEAEATLRKTVSETTVSKKTGKRTSGRIYVPGEWANRDVLILLLPRKAEGSQ